MGKRLVKKVVYFYEQGSDVEMTSESDEDESYHSSQDSDYQEPSDADSLPTDSQASCYFTEEESDFCNGRRMFW